jgi:flavin-binding protein dodecin
VRHHPDRVPVDRARAAQLDERLSAGGALPPEAVSRRAGGCIVNPRHLAAINHEEKAMAKKAADGVYRVIDVIGTSTKSWEDAAKNAVETAAASLRDLRVAEVSQLDLKVDKGKVVAYRARVQLSFKYEG